MDRMQFMRVSVENCAVWEEIVSELNALSKNKMDRYHCFAVNLRSES